jgi:uncharacterized protein (DUF3820 family)
MTDNDLMPFGVHKGKKMCNVPDSYLKWLYESNLCFGAIKKYIEENAQSLNLTIQK